MEENGSARPQRPSGGEAGETPVGSRVATQAGLSGDTGDVGRKRGWHGGGTQPVPQEAMLSGGEAGPGSANHYFEKCGWARRKENSQRGPQGQRGHPKPPSPDRLLPGAPDAHFKLQTSSLQWACCL